MVQHWKTLASSNHSSMANDFDLSSDLSRYLVKSEFRSTPARNPTHSWWTDDLSCYLSRNLPLTHSFLLFSPHLLQPSPSGFPTISINFHSIWLCDQVVEKGYVISVGLALYHQELFY
ncbi:hypothetical protein L2E82_16039 [Cichorium intybus]|uniref:Uncharacterized protein n=1 Tax=Cichorium intybus TaxID=13427 RepID=A0ACB9F4F4_CICIN|nr:hypothetical protein L2E82_16039 [Cichorium intybus]